MTRRCWVYVNGVAYEKGTEPVPELGSAFPRIMPDLPDFVSPIDGKAYSGRTGLREHCARHNVVPTADCAGLPTYQPPVDNRKAIRESVLQVMAQKGML